MHGTPDTRYAGAPAMVGLLALLAIVSLPVEFRVALVEHPVVAPPLLATLLLVGSCLLLVWSGFGLRRLEAERTLAQPPSPGA